MRQAELAAELLDLDPACIYTAERFNEELIRRFSEEDSHQPGEMEQALRRVHENPSTASEIFGRFKSMTGRERLHIVTHLVYGALSGSVPMPAAQLAGAAFPGRCRRRSICGCWAAAPTPERSRCSVRPRHRRNPDP